jgi:hypothetical protein
MEMSKTSKALLTRHRIGSNQCGELEAIQEHESDVHDIPYGEAGDGPRCKGRCLGFVEDMVVAGGDRLREVNVALHPEAKSNR